MGQPVALGLGPGPVAIVGVPVRRLLLVGLAVVPVEHGDGQLVLAVVDTVAGAVVPAGLALGDPGFGSSLALGELADVHGRGLGFRRDRIDRHDARKS